MASGLPVLLLVLISLTVAQAGLTVFNMRGRGLTSDTFGDPDSYVSVYYGSTHIGTTVHHKGDPNPWWDERFHYANAKEHTYLKLKVYDQDVIFDDLMGTCKVQIQKGTNEESCSMDKGGKVYYSYTLN